MLLSLITVIVLCAVNAFINVFFDKLIIPLGLIFPISGFIMLLAFYFGFKMSIGLEYPVNKQGKQDAGHKGKYEGRFMQIPVKKTAVSV
jgi:hypothetical protein